jgi:hypothetical protein
LKVTSRHITAAPYGPGFSGIGVFMPEHVSPQATSIERAGFSVLGVVIKAIETPELLPVLTAST